MRLSIPTRLPVQTKKVIDLEAKGYNITTTQLVYEKIKERLQLAKEAKEYKHSSVTSDLDYVTFNVTGEATSELLQASEFLKQIALGLDVPVGRLVASILIDAFTPEFKNDVSVTLLLNHEEN